MGDLTYMHGLTWVEWQQKFEAHYARLLATEPGFEGYGPSPAMQHTGTDSWRDYWANGYSPEEALAEDRTYWDD